jgi:hypothetical protein
MSSNPTSPEFCSAFRDALQAYLDGETGVLAAECEAHRAACAACRAEFAAAVALRDYYHRRSEIPLPAELTDRLVAAVLTDKASVQRGRQFTRLMVTALAIAACLLLAMSIGNRFWHTRAPTPIAPAPAPDSVAKDQKSNRMSVDESLASAGNALASLARRSANAPIEPPKLIPENSKFALNAPLPDAMEPAAQSLAEIRQGASSGFEPLGRTARRAFNLFLRDMPVQGDHKPGS